MCRVRFPPSPPGLPCAIALALALLTSPATAQPLSLSGTVRVLHGDGPGRGATERLHLLVDNRGDIIPLVVDDRLGAALESLGARGRRRVVLRGRALSAPAGGASGQPGLMVESVAPLATEGPDDDSLHVLGPQPWVTVLCRFADSATTPPRPRSFFEGLMGAVAPGLAHYWSEVSSGRMSLDGSVVTGWHDLPHPRSHYVYPQAGGGGLDFARITEDCTAAAEGDVFFPAYVGINLMFSDTLDCCGWGGNWTLSRNGQVRAYHTTWIPSWGFVDQDLVAHEMGHGFGLGHSSGPYGATYDSDWDLMSGGGPCSPPDPTYGCVAVHPIARHKDLLGWIPPERKLVVIPGSPEGVVLERLALPPATPAPLLIEIPIEGSAQYFTVESRRAAGYDAQVPGPAVLIHRVDPARADRQAQVVDPDRNGDPNDAAAMWRAGDTFTDAESGARVAVDGKTATGFRVSVAVSAYRLTVTATGGGTVTADPPGIGCTETCAAPVYRPGTVVVLTAAPPPGAPLVTWTGCEVASAATCRVTMSMDRSVAAAFASAWRLSVTRAGSGTVTSEPPGVACGSVCDAGFPPGQRVILRAAPAADWLFSGWSGCDGAAGDTCTLSMTENQAVAAQFVRTYRLTVTLQGHGRVTSAPSAIDCGTACASSYPVGTAVALTASSAPQSAFAGWSGSPDCADGLVTMTGDLACTASFDPAPDLVVTAVSDPPANARPASRLTVTDTVVNKGASGSGPAIVRYYLSAAPVRDGGARLLFGRRQVPGLGAGAASTGGANVWLPLGIPAGLYYLLACADDAAAVAEAGEGNNCRAAAAPVRIGWRLP